MGHHRPNTRSKNKRNRPDDSAEATAEIFRNILSTSQVTEDDVNQLFMISKPACQGCRVNTKDNPNCFCGLIPPPNGSRKSGLWQKTSEVVNALGPDPSDDRRASPETPAGLTNLGATCYANSILQCLYMNKSFRKGVFSIEPDVLKQQPVLDQLARLFAKLHLSKMAYVDSAPFIQTLELDNGVQQDSHEFLTLLFSLLERCLSRSSVLKARTVVQDLFRGGVSHVTKCSKCGNESEASSKIEDFYELELNVKGMKSLDESLDDYLSVEELQGDNQYYCDSCATRVDATRSIKLRSLPAVLNFQLKRCIFLPNTTTRKKITSAFYFPEELNMTRRISEHFQSELIYDLSAILIHKGSAANSGHYVAHIKNENTQQWWEFDDEHVSNLGCQPFGKGSSHSAVKPSQTEPLDHSSSDAINILENGNGPAAGGQQQASNTDVTEVKTFSSCDAYMLMYVLRRTKNGDKMSIDSSDDKAKKEACTSSEADSHLPSHLYEEVETLNDSYIDSCNQYKSRKESELNCITERRQEVRSILSKAAVQSPEKSYFWISMDWLRQWADNIMPSIIDNTSLQCTHGKVPVSKIGSMKRLSGEAWTMLFSKYGGGPMLAKDDYCIDCLFEVARSMARADNYRDRRTLMKELAEAALAGVCLDGKLYYISKTWLQQWLRRKTVDSPCDADAGPTASIRCPHGQLMPEQAAGARRVLIPESLWNFIREIAMAVKPDDAVGCSTFILDSEPCAQCNSQLTEVACLEDTLRGFKLKQRQSHERLAMGKSIPILPGSKYFLLPSSWLSKWKSYSNASGKSAPSAEPETLDAVIDLLMCEKHSRLLERPPDLVCKRGSILQKSPATDALTIITNNDWKLFCEDWGGTEAKGITAEIDCLGNEFLGSSEDMAISEEHMNLSDESNAGPESRKPIIKISLEVCEECIDERKSCELMRKLNYSNEDICVCFIRGKEPPKSVLEASVNSLEPNRRTSKRSRKTAFGNSVNLNVSGSTSVYQLKMMIWEAFGIVKENQVLHKGSLVIDGESACLADMNIFPGDVLWVTDSEIHEHRDIAENGGTKH
ncbi:ubiquitin carboxyl-terminal hydrolase 26 isoform X3 [Nicotiana tabacum]|uniref:Ubiquitin carboxyl-terminal hydrolase 26 n=2 Tax=Nicotiana tabacum TaxID=4097 RepID=A0A1S4A0U3_TOBAC|nr:PREDICTED: ubiquitin carboxyl-terminal hydrolase 26-like isoform X2 [Nicotiana tabacum]XP_033508808.1 ubiquitin carboxyl-terminal hydrolase 26 isoform X3 [Nicotiana tomentosiformis]